MATTVRTSQPPPIAPTESPDSRAVHIISPLFSSPTARSDDIAVLLSYILGHSAMPKTNSRKAMECLTTWLGLTARRVPFHPPRLKDNANQCLSTGAFGTPRAANRCALVDVIVDRARYPSPTS
jgi:hypothetical protein